MMKSGGAGPQRAGAVHIHFAYFEPTEDIKRPLRVATGEGGCVDRGDLFVLCGTKTAWPDGALGGRGGLESCPIITGEFNPRY